MLAAKSGISLKPGEKPVQENRVSA